MIRIDWAVDGDDGSLIHPTEPSVQSLVERVCVGQSEGKVDREGLGLTEAEGIGVGRGGGKGREGWIGQREGKVGREGWVGQRGARVGRGQRGVGVGRESNGIEGAKRPVGCERSEPSQAVGDWALRSAFRKARLP